MNGKRILVVRLGAMGDIIHTLPAVASVKQSFPQAHISWVVEERWASLLEGNPFVDELTKMFGLPRDVVLGRPETLYPEYRKTIKDTFVAQPPCTRNCGAPPPR